MKAATVEIPGDEHAEVRRYCWLRHDEVQRLDALSHKLHSLNGESTSRIHGVPCMSICDHRRTDSTGRVAA